MSQVEPGSEAVIGTGGSAATRTGRGDMPRERVRSGVTPYVLGAIAALLGVQVVRDAGVRLGEPAGAFADTPMASASSGSDEGSSGGRISAAEQRKQMINELKSLSARMERIEAQLKSGIAVRVTELPAAREAGPSRPAPSRAGTAGGN